MARQDSYDIILVIGQSNTHYGEGLDRELDTPDKQIKQLGRFGKNNLRIIDAREPLDHHTKQKNKIGFAMTFAKLYVREFLSEGREVLIIPGGYGGTGFMDEQWNKGDGLYNDAVSRTNLVLNHCPNSKVVAILWHQGENDVDNPSYEQDLDNFIANIRSDLENDTIPFILGGMVPYWVDKLKSRIEQQQIIKSTPARVNNTEYADPNDVSPIVKYNNEQDTIHYDAEGMRELGKRYFDKFRKFN